MILVTFGVFVIAVLLNETATVRPWRQTVPLAGLLLVPPAVPWFNAAPPGVDAMRSLSGGRCNGTSGRLLPTRAVAGVDGPMSRPP